MMTKIDPFQCYKMYVALKAHFNGADYDYFKSNGKVRATLISFEKRNDKSFFHHIVKKYNDKVFLEHFFVANFVDNNGMWIGDALEEDAKQVYTDWVKRTDSIGYVFREDMKKLLELIPGQKIASLYEVREGQHPIFLKAALEKEITFETFTILLKLVSDKFKKEALDGRIEDDIIWPEYKKKAEKYQGFLDIDNKRFREIIYDLT